MVSEPSTPGAYMQPDRSPDIGGEIGMYIKESKESKIDNLIDINITILIPHKTI